MSLPRANVEHVEHRDSADPELRAEEVAARALAKRLEEREIAPLRTLWCEMPSACGLRSNMGAQCERLAALPRREPRSKREPDALEARAAQAEAAWREQQRIVIGGADAPLELPSATLPPEPCEAIRLALAHTSTARDALAWWNARDGLHGTCLPGDIRAAHGVERPTMAIAGSVSVMPTHDGAAEAWVHRRASKNSKSKIDPAYDSSESYNPVSDAEKWTFRSPPLERGKMVDREQAPVERAYHALLRMIAAGREENVYALYAMYGDALPPTEFPAFGDIACLILATPTILEHAARLTRELRRDVRSRTWFVTAREAAHDLLDARGEDGPEKRAVRKQAKLAVAKEAEAMLIRASEDYRAVRAG